MGCSFLLLPCFPLHKRTIGPVVKRRGRIKGKERLAHTFQQKREGKESSKIRLAEIVTRVFPQQPPLFYHSIVQGSCGQRLQETGHGPGNGRALNEVSLPLKDVFRIRVETDDEASGHPKALTLD